MKLFHAKSSVQAVVMVGGERESMSVCETKRGAEGEGGGGVCVCVCVCVWVCVCVCVCVCV